MEKAEKIAAAVAQQAFTAREQRFTVEFAYPVYFTRQLFDTANPAFLHALTRLEPVKRHRLAVFLDDGLAACWPKLTTDIAAYADAYPRDLELLATPQRVPAGERAKNTPALITDLQRRLLELGVDRHAYVVAVGGGAVLDAVGYVAATTHRGVRHIRVPTTVLAQNDSGIGVKNSVNAFGIKNFVGTFAPPFAVLNDFDFLATLEPRDKVAGMAEAVKVALIRDRNFFDWLEVPDPPLCRVAFASYRGQRRPVRARQCAPARLRSLGSAQTRDVKRTCTAPW
jgi:3-dehydroquinate synthase